MSDLIAPLDVSPARGTPEPEYHDDIIYPPSLPFVFVHLACLGAWWSGVTRQALVLAAVLYVVRMFGVTAGYHRYFSHRAFKTSRVGQFLLAWLAMMSWQRGCGWWAQKHRHHHVHSDLPSDVHSPRHRGFWYAHLGWIFTPQHDAVDLSAVPDIARVPELRMLERVPYLPGILLALACYGLAGWPGLTVGFFWSTVCLYHGTFCINSLAHVHGTQRYVTGDDSRNNWWLSIITLGEGWHNNHHAFMASTRQGFRWYEFDPTFYVLVVLEKLGLVWDLNLPPAEIVENRKPVSRGVIEKQARQVAASVPAEGIAASLIASMQGLQTQVSAYTHHLALAELRGRLMAAQASGAALLHDLHLPEVPTVTEMRARVARMTAPSPATDAIARRAHQLVVEMVAHALAARRPVLLSASSPMHPSR